MQNTSPIRWFGVSAMLLMAAACCQGTCDEEAASTFPEMSGPYLGQQLPGLEPRLFAPGVVSTGMNELNSVF